MALRFLVVTILISSQLNPQFILFSTSEMNIHLFSADGNYEVRYKSNVLIYPDGEVLWIPPAIYQVNKLRKGKKIILFISEAQFISCQRDSRSYVSHLFLPVFRFQVNKNHMVVIM